MELKIKKEKPIDVTVIGRVTIDFNPTDYYKTLDKNKNFNMYLGGSAGNIVVGLLRHKKKVNFISRISNDQFGTFIKNYYVNENLEIDQLQIDPILKTGLTFTEMLNDQKSTILMYREFVADLNIRKEEIDFQKVKKSKIVLISGVSLSKEPSRESCWEVISKGFENESITIFDLDYRPYTWKNRNEVYETYHKFVKKSNILVGSEEEFSFLLKNDSNEEKEFEKLFKDIFKKYNVEIIILKKGSNGSVLYTRKNKICIGIAEVKLLKGFGGGDAYLSTFVSEILSEPNDLITALTNATYAASMVVSHLSSSEGLPTKEQLENFKKNVQLSKKATEIGWDING